MARLQLEADGNVDKSIVYAMQVQARSSTRILWTSAMVILDSLEKMLQKYGSESLEPQ